MGYGQETLTWEAHDKFLGLIFVRLNMCERDNRMMVFHNSVFLHNPKHVYFVMLLAIFVTGKTDTAPPISQEEQNLELYFKDGKYSRY